MNNSYLNIFGDLFYDVNSNRDVKNTIEQASNVLASLIIKFGELENELCFGTSRKDDFIDTVLCLFIRKVMEQIDAINILFSIGSFAQTQIILRSLVENIVSLQFILKEDTKKRAAAYWLEHHYEDIELGERLFGTESDLRKQIIANKGQESFDDDMNMFLKKKEAFERIIKSKPVFQEIDRERKRKMNRKRENKKYIKWYEVCSNVTSFKGMVKETGYEKYYDSIYGGLSYEVHAYNSTMDIHFNEVGMALKPIRNPVGGGSTFSSACAFSVSLLKSIYEYVGDGEMEKAEFQEFFVDFQNKRDITSQNLDMII